MKAAFDNAEIVSVGTDPVVYHRQLAARGTVDYQMSSSSLREVSRCARRWVRGYESPESKALAYGSLLDTLILTPGQFAHRYAIKPLTRKSVNGHKLVKWTEDERVPEVVEWLKQAEGKEIISQADYDNAMKAKAAFRQEVAMAMFVDASDTQVWVKGTYKDRATGIVIPVKCLLDLAPRLETEFRKSLADLKTSRNAGIRPWASFMHQSGYHIQAAWNTDLYVAATGEDRCSWSWLLQENYPPYETGWRLADPDLIDLGREMYRYMLGVYCRCLADNDWPGYDEALPESDTVQGAAIVRCEAWMRERDLAAMIGFPKRYPDPDWASGPPEEDEEEHPEVPTP